MIDAASVTNWLEAHFDLEISKVELIGAGMFSKAFAFRCNQQEFVIRFNAYVEDFQKDAFAYQHFASPELPISKVTACDRFSERYYFAITERCAGSTLSKLDSSIQNILPSLFTTLYAIHTLDVSTYTGWGLTDAAGNGQFVSWEEYLLTFYNQKFSFTWDQLFDNTCMEREVYEIYFSIIQDCLPFCSTRKYWLHGDFGFDNVMSDGQKITGVLDWAESRLGDFVYDIAYLEFYADDISYKQRWQEWAAGKQLSLACANFEQRIQCYMLHIGLASLAIAAIQNDIEDYMQVKARMQAIITVD